MGTLRWVKHQVDELFIIDFLYGINCTIGKFLCNVGGAWF